MKTLLRLLPFLALAFVAAHAADSKIIAAVKAADEERMAAIKAGDRARLDAIFSDELRYAHSSGKIDTKASYIQSLTSRNTVYESFEYKERNIVEAGPGVALVNGRVLVKAVSNGARADNDLNILAVYRLENGKWRFLAWQSCKNLPPAEPKK
jgi:ketosteroid isomerase-like protein